ncbi:alpha-xylosidase [Lactobacillus selangorensis]|uniref:Alpha-xylosidase n=1 Tax=Lactobacillus selangorensis TaxID=81857 RepID=A0A0R2FWJ9_9LACO|nr:TIM-barrel domain-containing protein [Lactobacillus selangorensis]KRN28853.1 alpha-xylosidase [Lactobacillus selangorensis]KRN32737.1 alpha-xylosidase [Lactobacillus selangorensis]
MKNINQVTGKNYRFTILTDKLLRMEYSQTDQFEDRLTQAVQNRDFPLAQFEVTENQHGHVLEIETDAFHLYYDGGPFSAGTLFIDAKYNYGTHYSRWYYGEPIQKNLKGTARTLDKADGAIPLDDGLMTKDGFSILDDSDAMIQDGGKIAQRSFAEQDVYYFAYGRDYLATLNAYYQLTGFPPLVPRFALGNWWSRFYPYTQAEYLQLMDRFDRNAIPISVSVFDMNWHRTDFPAEYASGWTGYTWNKKLFPDPVGMMKKLHQDGKHITLNVHPASGIRAPEEHYRDAAKIMDVDPESKEPLLFNLQDPKFRKAYFEAIHHPLEKEGVDFWWIDWQQGAARSNKQVDPLWVLNVLHYQDQQQKDPNNALILSRYGGPGSHRYPVGFSGDTVASWKSLDFQPYFTVTASNIGYTWWSHDIGVHMLGTYNPELSLRWLQFGVFSPIMRLHSSDNPFMGKEPWNYDLATEKSMTAFMQLRAQLIPYLETANYQTHLHGIPLMQPLYYQSPNRKEAYQFPNEYYFGSELLVAPITKPADAVTREGHTSVWLPEGDWYDFFSGVKYAGNGSLKVYRDGQHYPVFVKSGGIVPLNPDFMQPADALPAKLQVRVYPGRKNHYDLYEQQDGHTAVTHFDWNMNDETFEVQVEDDAHILPAQRQITLEFIDLSADELDDGRLTIAGTQNQLVQLHALTELPQAGKIHQLVRQKLQMAHLDFDLKAKIWDELTGKHSQPQKIRFVAGLDNQSVAQMLLELLTLA